MVRTGPDAHPGGGTESVPRGIGLFVMETECRSPRLKDPCAAR